MDASLYLALGLYFEGKLSFGTTETIGGKEGGVGLARNRYYEAATPEEVNTAINRAEEDIRVGTITVGDGIQVRWRLPEAVRIGFG